jgi:hypothetical protein
VALHSAKTTGAGGVGIAAFHEEKKIGGATRLSIDAWEAGEKGPTVGMLLLARLYHPGVSLGSIADLAMALGLRSQTGSATFAP